MHANLRALLDLHDINQSRVRLLRAAQDSEKALQAERDKAAALVAKAEALATEATSADALIRKYEADIARCDETIEQNRAQQSTAKTNKEYLALINGIEDAKNEKRLREESLTRLQADIDGKKAAAEAAKTEAEQQAAVVSQQEAAAAEETAGEESLENLERLYNEQKVNVDGELLQVYERLMQSRARACRSWLLMAAPGPRPTAI